MSQDKFDKIMLMLIFSIILGLVVITATSYGSFVNMQSNIYKIVSKDGGVSK